MISHSEQNPQLTSGWMSQELSTRMESIVPTAGERPGSILVPTDLSPRSRQVASYAARLAENLEARLVLVYLVKNDPQRTFMKSAESHEWASQHLARHLLAERGVAQLREQLLAENSGSTREIQTLICEGQGDDMVAHLARELSVDLVVVASNAAQGEGSLYIGATAENLVRHCPCPVLVVRGGELEG